MRQRMLLAALATAAALATTLAPASAFSPPSRQEPTVCKTGYVYSAARNACVKASSGLLDDRELYESGHALAKAGHYPQAIAVLEAVRDQEDPMVLTMIGYALRKQGQWDAGVAAYRRALALDPKSVDTRAYLGEAFLTKGRVDLAIGQLAAIEAIAGTDSEQYTELAFAIAEGGTW